MLGYENENFNLHPFRFSTVAAVIRCFQKKKKLSQSKGSCRYNPMEHE